MAMTPDSGRDGAARHDPLTSQAASEVESSAVGQNRQRAVHDASMVSSQMHSLPVLYSFRRCPYAMRARLAIAASGQRCLVREVVLRDKPPALLQASPKGTVPVLVLPEASGERIIDESLDI